MSQGDIAVLGVRVESGEAVTAADNLDSLAKAGERAEKAAAAVEAQARSSGVSIKELATGSTAAEQSMGKLAAAEEKVAETSSEAMARLTAMAKASLEASDYHKGLASSVVSVGGAMETAKSAATDWSAYQAQINERGRALIDTENRISAAARQAAVTTGVQADGLQELLGRIDPAVAALGRLDEMERRLQGFKSSGALDAETFADYKGKIDQARQELGRMDSSLSRTGMSAKATAAALRGVPAQLTDIVVSLQGGQAPLTVLLQQGGQLKDMFGGIGPAARAMGGYIVGLVNPFTVAAAAVAGLGVAYYKGSEEQEEFRKSLILSGNAAGTNVGAMTDLSRQIAATVGTTGAAAEILAQLAGNANIAGESIGTVATAALQMQDATGRAVEQTVAEFVKIGKDPVSAAKELNDQYNFLTASTYAQIAALKEQGDTVGAAKLLTDTYAQTIDTRTKEIVENLGWIEKAWRGVWGMTKNAGDAALDFGRSASLAAQLAEAQKDLAALEKNVAGNSIVAKSAEAANERTLLESRIQALNDQIRIQKSIDQAQENYRKRQRDSIAGMHEVDKLEKSAWTNAEKRADKLKTYRKSLADIRKENPDDQRLNPDRIARVEADIAKQFKDPAVRTTPMDLSSFNDQKNALGAILAEYKNHQKELDAAQKAGLVSQKSYASQRAAIIEQQKGDVTSAYEAEIKALEDAKGRSTTSAQQKIQLDQKIADARAAMVKAQKDADSELAVLATNEEGRLKRQTAAVQAYTDQLERERQVRATAGDRAAAALGMGDRQAGLQRELDGVSDEFNRKRETLLDRRRTAPDKYSAEDYKRDLAILEEAENRYRETVVGNYDKISAAQGDWRNGASSAFATYLEQARDVAGQTRTLFSNAFTSMEDAVASFATTGKLSFSDFTKSVLADMARIAARQAITGLAGSLFGSAVGGLFGGGAAAASSAFTPGSAGAISSKLGASAAGYSAAYGFSDGGYTGDGAKYQPMGVVHGGEFVLRKEVVAQPGMRSYLHQLNQNGYADGGYVTPMPVPRQMTNSVSQSQAAPVSVAIRIDGSGASQVQSSSPGLEQFGKEIGAFVDARYRKLLSMDLRPDGAIGRSMQRR
ncbi:phage tail tape measure protein [Pseudomonas sp. REB1044]|uniref:phage tail tape measure protein n=1 Tax=Pseudomonas sp. REB1044 TaxID=2675224 RepID=UPI00315D6C1C